MEALFLDVGFGTCNVILTGSAEAILLDVGKQARIPLAVLHQFSIKRISHFILSHWHDDHYGGANALLRAYSGRIGKVWFPFDPAFRKTEFWKALCGEVEAGRMKQEQVQPLMINGGSPRKSWHSVAHDCDLSIISPCFMENLQGVAAGDSNATCGILVLRVGASYIVFGGDATLGQWQQVPARIKTPLSAEVLAVPHHAGIIWPTNWTPAQIQVALAKLYTQIIQPKVAIISAGTRPGEKHPREDVVAALHAAQAAVMCTQMTRRCTSDLEAARKLQTGLPLLIPGRSSQEQFLTPSGKSNHVACAGSVLVELRKSGALVHQLAAHQTFVSRIPNKTGKKPLCR